MSAEDFEELLPQWEKALEPIEGEEVIEFPKGNIGTVYPKWPGSKKKPQRNIPIGPLESIFAMYHGYLFFGRHLLLQEILELANTVFPGMGIKFVTFFDMFEKPADEWAVVLGAVDEKNKDRLRRRCHRWFTDYLRANPQARARAKHLLGFRGRLDNPTKDLPNICARKLEYWEACIHYGVIFLCTNQRPIGDAESILRYHYNAKNSNHKRSITMFSERIQKENDSIGKDLIIPYKKHEQFWMDKAQDVILEHESGAHGSGPRKYDGHRLPVPFELRHLLGLKGLHITLNSSDAGPLMEIFDQYQNPERERASFLGQVTNMSNQSQYLQGSQSSYSGQFTDLGSQRQYSKLPQIDFGPETGSSAQARAGPYQPYDPSTLSQRQEMHNMPSNQSFRAQYQRHHQALPQGDPMFAATTSMGNLNLYVSAPGPGQEPPRYNDEIFPSDPKAVEEQESEASVSRRDRPRYKDDIFASTPKASTPQAVEEQEREEEIEPRKSKSSKESRRKEKHPKKHDRSETPPEKQGSSKRPTGKESR